MRVRDLFVYPLKSARAIAVETADITPHGFKNDRFCMVVAPDGRFITQRDCPDLARIQTSIDDHGLLLRMDGQEEIQVPFYSGGDRMDVTIWDSIVNAAIATPDINTQLSQWLNRDIKLVIFDDKAQRSASVKWAGSETPVMFADGFQILVTTTGSLEALNADLEQHDSERVGMERFRTNMVIETDEAWAEDQWEAIEIGGIRFDLVKPCPRCIITTQDQQTGSRDGATPMPAMMRLRFSADKRVSGPLFGWNVTPRGVGTIKAGDAVKVLANRQETWAFKQRA